MLPFSYRQALMVSMVGMVVCLSLVVITGFVGQVSLAQVTLAGVAGFAVSHMTAKAGVGFPWGPLVGSAAAVVIGLVVGVSALRVRGVSLAVVTLAGVVAIEQFGFANRRWGAGSTGSPVEQPELFGFRLGSNAGFRGLDGKVPSPVLGFVFLVVVVALCLLVASLRRSVLGQQMLSVRANERAAAATGINVTNVKVAAYAISSFIAGTAGWMYAYNFGSVSAARFGILIALGFVAFAYIGGITMVSGAVIGGLVATEGLIPYTIEEALNISGNWTLLVGGVILIVTLIQNPEGIAGTTYRKRTAAKRAKAAAAARARAGEGQRDATRSRLNRNWSVNHECPGRQGISVSFGGVHAVVDVDLEVGPGELVGLIGPNGAGKTTFIDAITGFVPHLGTVAVDGADVTGLQRPRPRPAGDGAHVAGDRAVRRPHRAREPHGVGRAPVGVDDGQGGVRPHRRPLRLDRRGARRVQPGRIRRRHAERVDARPAQAGGRRQGAGRAHPSCCASTSRPPGSTPTNRWRSGVSCAGSSTVARRPCWSTTTWASCSASATGSS